MAHSFGRCYEAVCEWATAHGIRVNEEALPSGKAGEFDGLNVTMNRDYKAEERIYYLIHALGSVVLWSLNEAGIAEMFSELRDKKSEKADDHARFETAIAKYRDFEVEASKLAVSLFDQLGQPDKVSPYTNFMRADLEAMTEFHRTGIAPVWSKFFDRWNHEVASGSRQVAPFDPKPIPPFQPVRIERQEILQRQSGDQ
jgi:hypothetical protein